MSQILFVVDKKEHWPINLPGVAVVDAKVYLTDPSYSNLRNVKVFNLCRSYAYQSLGYYVSLLAEARGHKPKPNIATIQDMKSISISRRVSGELDDLIQTSLAHLQSNTFELSVYFSRNVAKHYDKLSRHFFNLFQTPFLRVHFEKDGAKWIVQNISPIATSDIPKSHFPQILEFIQLYFSKRTARPKKVQPRYALAILVDPNEKNPPSDLKALQRFIKAAENLAFSTEIIDKDDYGRLGEFDALFIRTTTAVNDYTYRFARRAETEGLIVIDDPQSIVKCANKVFCAELFERQHIRTPKTLIVHKGNYQDAHKVVKLPCVLKKPDSSFSIGVKKVNDEQEYRATIEQMLEKSDLIVVQEFLPTPFDWRIGIIDQKPFFACRYHMAPKHWQIYNHGAGSGHEVGRVDTLPVEMVPRAVTQMALKAANLIGNGLYGVDVKEIAGKPYIVEVNDNPNVDYGIEDEVLRESLYERVMETFLKRLEQKRMLVD